MRSSNYTILLQPTFHPRSPILSFCLPPSRGFPRSLSFSLFDTVAPSLLISLSFFSLVIPPLWQPPRDPANFFTLSIRADASFLHFSSAPPSRSFFHLIIIPSLRPFASISSPRVLAIYLPLSFSGARELFQSALPPSTCRVSCLFPY